MKRSRALLLAGALACTEKPAPTEMLAPPPPGIAAKPRWLSYTCVEPGCETTRTTQISVLGSRNIAIKRIVLSDRARTDFEIVADKSAPFVLEAGARFQLQATYRPTGDPLLADVDALVTYSDAVEDEGPDRVVAGELRIPLVRRLIGEPVLAAEPALVVFGPALPGARLTETVALKNTGFGNVGVVLESVESDRPEVTVSGLPTTAILPNAMASIEVAYAPTDERFTEALITITPALIGSEPAFVRALGTSIPRPTIAVVPERGADLGEVAVGAMKMASVELMNRGSVPLEISRIEIDGTGSTQLAVALPGGARTATIAALESTPAQLTLTAATPGPVDAVVRVFSNDRDRPRLELPVVGLVTKPRISVTPSTLDFGVVPRGWTLTRRVEIENVGYGALTLETIGLVLGSSALYTVQNGPLLPKPLAHQERVSFEVEFRAEAQATFMGRVGIESSDPDTEFVEVALRAQGAACMAACPIANGTPSCMGGLCGVGSCNAGFFDTDADPSTGCECQDLGRDPGPFCAEGESLGVLRDTSGDSRTYSGKLPTADDVDIITFFAEDANSGVSSEDYDVRVRLESADPTIELCVYRHDTRQHENGCFLENERCGREYRHQGRLGNEDGADFVLKVFRRAGGAGSCTPYTVFARNG